MRFKMMDLPILVLSIIIPLLAGGLGSLATAPAIPVWYRSLTKPSWTPPSWLFGPVWTLLFVLMGIALFLVWRKGWSSPGVTVALAVFGIQLVLNVLWSVLFFGLRQPGWALLDICLLWVFILLTLLQFIRQVTAAGVLLVPYLAWVSFALALNVAIWRLNR